MATGTLCGRAKVFFRIYFKALRRNKLFSVITFIAQLCRFRRGHSVEIIPLLTLSHSALFAIDRIRKYECGAGNTSGLLLAGGGYAQLGGGLVLRPGPVRWTHCTLKARTKGPVKVFIAQRAAEVIQFFSPAD